MKIGIATCLEYKYLQDEDKKLVHSLEKAGIECKTFVWDEEKIPDDCEIILIRSIWDYHRKFDLFKEFLVRMEQSKKLILNPVKILRWNMEKLYLMELINDGFPLLKTRLFNLYEVPSIKDLEIFPECFIIKPSISAGAFKTEKFFKKDLSKAILFCDSLSKGSAYLIQEYWKGIEHFGEQSYVFFGGQFSHAVIKKPAEGDFRVQFEFGGSYSPVEPKKEILDLCSSIIAKYTKDCVYTRIDFVHEAEKTYLMEIELIEPFLFFESNPNSYNNLISAITKQYDNWSAYGK